MIRKILVGLGFCSFLLFSAGAAAQLPSEADADDVYLAAEWAELFNEVLPYDAEASSYSHFQQTVVKSGLIHGPGNKQGLLVTCTTSYHGGGRGPAIETFLGCTSKLATLSDSTQSLPIEEFVTLIQVSDGE